MKKETVFPPISKDERIDKVNEDIVLIQKKDGLTFGTDAYLLSAFLPCRPRHRVVELGSGTGIIPLLLTAKNKAASVTAVEIQESFADLIRRNAALNGMEDRIRVLCKDVREVLAEDVGGETDTVISNPPYLKTACGKSNGSMQKEIARHEVCGDIFDFCKTASRLLRTKGKFICVYRSERLADLFSAMRQNRLEPKRMVTVHSDSTSAPCMVLVEAMKDAAASLKVLPPLFLYEPSVGTLGKRVMTRTAAMIYETCSFPF